MSGILADEGSTELRAPKGACPHAAPGRLSGTVWCSGLCGPECNARGYDLQSADKEGTNDSSKVDMDARKRGPQPGGKALGCELSDGFKDRPQNM